MRTTAPCGHCGGRHANAICRGNGDAHAPTAAHCPQPSAQGAPGGRWGRPGRLLRWVLAPDASPTGQRAFLHHFMAPDHPCLHSHPWDFDTLILSGGYRALEYRPRCGSHIFEVVCTAGARHHLGGGADVSEYHCVTAVDPCTWTVVTPQRASSDWGYLVLADQQPPAPGIAVTPAARHVSYRDYVPTPPPPAPVFRNGYRPTWHYGGAHQDPRPPPPA